MKRLICCLAVFLSCTVAFSQKVYFIYLQTEQEQPFFVKMNDKIFSSAGSGYLILSKLRDSSYHFRVGFPDNKWPEQQFTVPIRGSDHGFLLKNFGEKGWGLFDLQTSSVQMGNESGGKVVRGEPVQVSAFTEVLAKAANDPSLREQRPVMVKAEDKPFVAEQAVVKEETATVKDPPAMAPAVTAPVKKEEMAVTQKAADKKEVDKKEDTTAITSQATEVAAMAKDTALGRKDPDPLPVDKVENTVMTPARDTVAVRKEEPVAIVNGGVAEKKEEAKGEPVVEYKRSVIIKKSESSTSEGAGAVYIDQDAAGKADTIRIMIPNQRSLTPAVTEQPKEQPKQQKKFLDLSTSDKDMTPSTTSTPIGSMNKPVAVARPKCASQATEADFLKLRKKMAGEKNDQAMINEGKKVFRVKCVSTEQVRNLGSLFLNEAGKFQFYEAAYPRVSDPGNFQGLETEFKDPYFVHRLKNLVN